MYWCILQFSSFNWSLVSYHSYQNMLDMNSVFLNLLRCVLWPSIWSILENVLCILEKNVYSPAFGWNVLYICICVCVRVCVCVCVYIYIFICANVSFKATGSVLTFCLDDLYIDISGVLVPYYYFIVVYFSHNIY